MSFPPTSGTASGTFTNCVGGDDSFGRLEANGTFNDCTGGVQSFAAYGTLSGTFTRCFAGPFSFDTDEGILSGSFFYCRTSGGIKAPVGAGIIRHCINADGDIFNGQAI
jgi:hypothetical protein